MLTDIGSGTLPPGARLGSERELAEHYGVSRGTLRQVLSQLEEAGLVRRVAGRTGGTFITHGKVEHDLTKVVEVQIGRAHVELQSLMRISYAVFCLNKKKNK